MLKIEDNRNSSHYLPEATCGSSTLFVIPFLRVFTGVEGIGI